ncbi:MAG: hypothetical protein JSS07_08045 [Proteobacteria bacterium]|nr:hypothetical protein [Pseudomonadota bacterium]
MRHLTPSENKQISAGNQTAAQAWDDIRSAVRFGFDVGYIFAVGLDCAGACHYGEHYSPVGYFFGAIGGSIGFSLAVPYTAAMILKDVYTATFSQ